MEWAAFMTILQPPSRSFGLLMVNCQVLHLYIYSPKCFSVHKFMLIIMHLIKAYSKVKEMCKVMSVHSGANPVVLSWSLMYPQNSLTCEKLVSVESIHKVNSLFQRSLLRALMRHVCDSHSHFVERQL